MLLRMLRRLLIAVAVSLVVAPAASATTVAEIIDQNGHVIAAAGTGRFDYPANGSLLHIGSSRVTPTGVELGDVALLGGRIQAVRIVVPRRAKAAQVEGLFVDGHAVRARVNRLIPLSAADYLITSQAAVGSGRRVGLVGLRLSFGRAALGLPAGAQILVGLPASSPSAAPAKKLTKRSATPLAVLGFTDRAALATLATLPTAAFFPSGTIGEKAVSIVQRYLGIPYVWAGADPTGFDCSGLVMYVYGQLGIHLTHYTGSQIHEGTPVPREALLPGDIVFFFSRGGVPGHEGMYIGNGQFIQAPHTGDVVKISSMNDPHYAFSYVGAVRPY